MLVSREKMMALANKLAQSIVKNTKQANESITRYNFLDARYNVLLEYQKNLDFIFIYLVISYLEQTANIDFAYLVLQATLKTYYCYEDYMQILLDDIMKQSAILFANLEQYIGETTNLSAFEYYRKVGVYLVQTSSFEIQTFALNDSDTNMLGKCIQDNTEQSIQDICLIYDSILTQ
jgi:hypothetical protein